MVEGLPILLLLKIFLYEFCKIFSDKSFAISSIKDLKLGYGLELC